MGATEGEGLGRGGPGPKKVKNHHPSVLCGIVCRSVAAASHAVPAKSDRQHVPTEIPATAAVADDPGWRKTLSLSHSYHTPSRTLCSSDSKLLLFVPRVRICFGFSQLRCCRSNYLDWNSLPLAIRSSVSTYSFRRQLKTFFCNLAFRPSY